MYTYFTSILSFYLLFLTSLCTHHIFWYIITKILVKIIYHTLLFYLNIYHPQLLPILQHLNNKADDVQDIHICTTCICTAWCLSFGSNEFMLFCLIQHRDLIQFFVFCTVMMQQQCSDGTTCFCLILVLLIKSSYSNRLVVTCKWL